MAALMLTVIGGLAVMLGSSPLAAQTAAASAVRSAPSAVAPSETFTVTISVGDYGLAAFLTETLPAGFEYGDSEHELVTVTGQEVEFTLIGETEVAYTVTAPDTASSSPGVFSGVMTYRDDAGSQELIMDDSEVTVADDTVTPEPTPVAGDGLQFDIVPAKAVKGAVVSGLNHPIGSKPLQWDVSDVATGTLVSIANDGIVGDFQIKDAGSGKFQLVVMNSGAPSLSGSQSINVALSYDDDTTVNLTGDINEQDALAFTNSPFNFTIPQSTSADTPIGAFGVSGGVAGEYLDGIVSGGPFQVRDSDMTLVYSGSSALEVKMYTLALTVNGDAGMANRAIIGTATVTVTASNLAPSAPATFAETIKENEPAAGLVKAGTDVGDASAGVSANDGDSLTYTLVGADGVFDIDADSGMITVDSGISDDDEISYTFKVMVSDGVSANNQYIAATVDIDVNDPTELVADADLPAGVTATDDGYAIAVSVTDDDVPDTLFNLGDMVTDADGDDLTFSVSGNPSHIVYDSDTDNVDLTYLPPGSEEGRVDTITVGVSDGFNGADDDDQTLSIEISVTEEEPDPITSSFVGITVAENSTDCSQGDVASGCSVADIVSGATSFSIESGVDGGDTDYAVADDGTITVLNAPNYEDGLDPAFLVNANGADGLVGLISVRVSVTDVNESPVLAAIAGVPWVYETAQIGDAVVEKPAAQDGPAATDLPISISANDPEGATLTYSISSTGKVPIAVDSSTGALTVSGALDKETAGGHTFTVKAADPAGNSDEMEITVHVLNANETPQFTSPTGDDAVTTIPENTGNALVIFTFTATDEDRDDLTFTLREGQSRDLFVIESAKSEVVGRRGSMER